ncbi:MAG: NAD(P)-dependent oxidoreductase [Brevinema sp.]
MTIGFIGLGIMGEPMSQNLVKKRTNDTVLVYDLDPQKIEVLMKSGAKGASSAKEVVEKSDIILSIIPKSEHVRALCQEVLPAFKAGKIWIDMSTIDPDASIEVAETIKKTGADFLDCPLVKSKAAAIDGTLGIYVGGNKQSYEKIKDILLCMGNNVIHLGANGAGLVMKACHNNLVSQIQNGVNEMILLAQKAGISPETFEKAISYGGGQNFYLSGKYKNIQNNDFPTAFSVENMHKDVYIVERIAQQYGLKLQGMENTKKIYDHAMKLGMGKEDFSATFKAVRDIAEE